MDQDKEESKVKYTISKSENGRDIIRIDNDNKEESKISKEDAVKVVSKWAEGAKSKKKEIMRFIFRKLQYRITKKLLSVSATVLNLR